MKKIAFIGMGNMAQAIASGIIGKNVIERCNVLAYAPHIDKLKSNAELIGFTPYESMTDMISVADIVIMACKPYQIEGVLKEAAPYLSGKALVSIAAGWDYQEYAKQKLSDTRIQYVMPNTPAMVGEGVMIFEETNSLNKDERDEIIKLFEQLGVVVELPSHLMGIGTALTGCGPAFVDLIIEALGDAGVKYGLPRKQCYEMVSQMILGSAKLQLETGTHPGVLKDNVCSPGGTTIKGVEALEKAGCRNTFIEAINAIMNK